MSDDEGKSDQEEKAETTENQDGEKKAEEGKEEVDDDKLEDEGVDVKESGAKFKKSTDRSKLSDKVEDFQVRVKILEGRQLAGSNIKPVVKVQCGPNLTKITRVRKGSAPIWGEMMIFNFKESLKNLYDFVIEFTVSNSKQLRSDSLIGYFKLDLGNVYDQDDHAYVRKWILLTDPEDSSNTPKGYLKTTMCILGAGDQPPSEGGKDDDDDVEGNLLTPAGAALRSAIFVLRVFKAEDMPQMDTGALQSMKKLIGIGSEGGEAAVGLVDPYLSFRFAGKKRKTKVMKGNSNPEWHEELWLPLKFPSMCDTLQLTVFDWDRIGSNDPVGTIKIPISRISSTGEESDTGFLPTFGPTFVNIYGSTREFSGSGDNLEAMNFGKCEGCAYRGRVMVELETKLEEEDAVKPPKSQPIEEDLIESSKKYLRRRKYELVVTFESASMMEKTDKPIEFEVSIGNFGNKFDSDTQASSSATEPIWAVFEGTYYYYLPWGPKKPVVCVPSHWEDSGFRYHALNVILRMTSKMENDIDRVKKMIAEECDEVDVAAEIVEILNALLLFCTKAVPDPRGRTAANSLDSRLYELRMQHLASLRAEASQLRQTCIDANFAVGSLEEYLERLKEMIYEPQSNMPDVVIWMLSEKKRIAYARIPANEVLFCKERAEYSGRMCGKMQTVFLKCPTTRRKSKKKYKIACKLQARIWLGKSSDHDDFNFKSRGKLSVWAETYETEMKLPVKGWKPDGFKDRSAEVPLPKDKFICPPGWEWDEGWMVAPSTSAHSVSSGVEVFAEEAYEVQYRPVAGGIWQAKIFLDRKEESISDLDSIKCLEGWQWQDEWEVDCSGACDEEGWEYAADMSPIWDSMEKMFHLNRKRRWVRTRKCVDTDSQAKKERERLTIDEGWEYAKTTKTTYRPEPRGFDLVRRRRWMRRLVAGKSKGSAAIFSLDRPLVHFEGAPEPADTSTSNEEPPSTPTDSKPMTEDKPEEPAVEEVKEKTTLTKKQKKERRKTGITSGAKAKKKKIPKLPTPRIYLEFEDAIKLQLRVYIYQARDLSPMDQDNFADPFVFATFMNECKRTDLLRHTLNPIWDQSLIMDLEYFGDLNNLETSCPNVIVEIFDKDDIIPIGFTGKKSRVDTVADKGGRVSKRSVEFMGRSALQPLFRPDPEEPASPRLAWHDVMRGNVTAGSLLATAELFVKSEDKMMPFLPPRRMEAYKVPPGIRPKLQRTALEFLIWGVRNMEPFKLLSVERPSVVIEIGEVEIRTEVIKKYKKLPNFSEPVIFLEANLPIEQIYCPPIVIRVKDHRKFGRRPTVGQRIISDLNTHIIPAPPVKKEEEDEEEDEGFGGMAAVIEIIPATPTKVCETEEMPEATRERSLSYRELLEAEEGEEEEGLQGDIEYVGDKEYEGDKEYVEVEVYDPDAPPPPEMETSEEEEEEEEEEEQEEEPSGRTIMDKLGNFGKQMAESSPLHLIEKIQGKLSSQTFASEFREEEIDWWSKYYASVGEDDKCGQYLSTGMDTIKIYTNELEMQKPYNNFSDFIQTFHLYRGKQGKHDDDAPRVVGEFKGAIFMYPLPEDPNDPMPERIFRNIPSSEPVEVKVRVYVIRAFDLAPQDSNGLADPYLKIKVGKKRKVDRANYLPNTLNPVFGRMFELDLILPMEKDLRVEVFDWDLIGTDDKVGETVIDLENRYYSKYKAWCGVPESYFSQGPNKWRDQMTPKEWLVQKAKDMKIDEPIWNGNTCVLFNRKKYLLESFEKSMIPCKDWGSADQRLALHVLKTLPHVPEHVETRPLYIDILPGIEQGRLQLWVDMFPNQFGEPEDAVDISPRQPSEYFLRVVIWNCQEIPMMDVSMFGEQMTDIYVKGWVGGKEHKKQKTDVHHRSLDGTGMFNWRFVFPFDYLQQEHVVVVKKKDHLFKLDKTTSKFPPVLYIQVWDNDIFGPNEYISEIEIPLIKAPKPSKFSRFATLKNIPDLQGNCSVPLVNMFDQKILHGWWPLYAIKDGEQTQAGKIEMTIEVATTEEHEEKPTGKARDEPNENPKLEKPKRPATSFAWFSSPWKSFRYIIWRKYGCILITIFLVLLLIVFIALFIYTLPGSVTRSIMGKG